MRLIYNAKLTVKFLGSFIILIAAMIFVGIFGLVNMQQSNEAARIIYQENFIPTSYIERIDTNITAVRLYCQKIVLEIFKDDMDENLKLLNDTSNDTTAYLDNFEKAVGDDPENLRLVAELRDALGRYRTERTAAVELAQAGDFEAANTQNTDNVIPRVIEVQGILAEIIEYNTSSAAGNYENAAANFESSRGLTVGVLIGISIVGLLLGIFMSTIISRGVDAVREASKQIAAGDLTVVLPERYLKQKDEVGRLARNIDEMKHGLIDTVTGIKASTDNLDEEITATNNTLGLLNDRITDSSAATEELSASMQETGASAQEMNATAAEIERAVENVAEKAEEGAGKSNEIHSRASDLGKHVNDSIKKSNQIFGEIKATLQKALEDSKAVDEINALADAILGITSQTTLLALNASIEAARAGEAGRGFAVVANEISSLADNSKNTVTQIQAITKVVMTAVNALANSSTNLLNFVSEDVMTDYQDMLQAADSYNADAIYMSDMTSDLSATSEELLASVQVMMRAINEVAAAAQEGARTTTVVAEQATDISVNASTIVDTMKDAKHTSDELVSLVDKFKL